jgi:hypothetical protein
MKLQSIAVALLLSASATISIAADLINLTVRDSPMNGGKVLEMEFHELERTAATSLVEVKFVSGSSVASSLFILKGMCAIARSRGAGYFTTDQVHHNPSRYKVTFANSPPPEVRSASEPSASSSMVGDRGFSFSECIIMGF